MREALEPAAAKPAEAHHFEPGETRTVEFTLGPDALSFLDEQMYRVVERGIFDVMVGPNAVNLKAVRLEVVGK